MEQKCTVSFSLDREDLKIIDELAAKDDRSRGHFVRNIIRKYLADRPEINRKEQTPKEEK